MRLILAPPESSSVSTWSPEPSMRFSKSTPNCWTILRRREGIKRVSVRRTDGWTHTQTARHGQHHPAGSASAGQGGLKTPPNSLWGSHRSRKKSAFCCSAESRRAGQGRARVVLPDAESKPFALGQGGRAGRARRARDANSRPPRCSAGISGRGFPRPSRAACPGERRRTRNLSPVPA